MAPSANQLAIHKCDVPRLYRKNNTQATVVSAPYRPIKTTPHYDIISNWPFQDRALTRNFSFPESIILPRLLQMIKLILTLKGGKRLILPTSQIVQFKRYLAGVRPRLSRDPHHCVCYTKCYHVNLVSNRHRQLKP